MYDLGREKVSARSGSEFKGSQSVSQLFPVPPRAHPSTGSQSGSATPGLTQVTAGEVQFCSMDHASAVSASPSPARGTIFDMFITLLPSARPASLKRREPSERVGN